MDTELVLLQVEEIEMKIEQLIEKCKSLEITNLELNNRVENFEKELQDKIENENIYIKDREMLGSKIDGLLNKLEEKENV